MDSGGPKNKPILVFSLRDVAAIFGDVAPDRRDIRADKEWVDAYNTQINRMLIGKKIEELSHIEIKMLKLILKKYIGSSWAYILKKHCK